MRRGKLVQLKPYTLPRGYCALRISHKGTSFSWYVHRLVYLFFSGRLNSKLTINHKNGIKSDNSIDNLEEISLKANARHGRENGLYENRAKGERINLSKLTEKKVKKIRILLKSKRISEIASIYKVHPDTIRAISNGRTWKHV